MDNTTNFNLSTLSAVSEVNSVYPVKKLEEFKGKDTPEGMYFVRKIEKGTGLDSKGVFIPTLDQTTIVQYLESGPVFEAVCNFVQSSIGEVVKARISAGTSSIIPSDYSLEKLVEYLSAEEVKQGRISKEKIATWFDSQVARVLKQAFTEKLGNVENDKMLEILKAYKGNFVNLAKREYSANEQVKLNLGKALALLQESPMVDYCRTKLAASTQAESDLAAL